MKWIPTVNQADAPTFASSVAATSPGPVAVEAATTWAPTDSPAKVSFFFDLDLNSCAFLFFFVFYLT